MRGKREDAKAEPRRTVTDVEWRHRKPDTVSDGRPRKIRQSRWASPSSVHRSGGALLLSRGDRHAVTRPADDTVFAFDELLLDPLVALAASTGREAADCWIAHPRVEGETRCKGSSKSRGLPDGIRGSCRITRFRCCGPMGQDYHRPPGRLRYLDCFAPYRPLAVELPSDGTGTTVITGERDEASAEYSVRNTVDCVRRRPGDNA